MPITISNMAADTSHASHQCGLRSIPATGVAICARVLCRHAHCVYQHYIGAELYEVECILPGRCCYRGHQVRGCFPAVLLAPAPVFGPSGHLQHAVIVCTECSCRLMWRTTLHMGGLHSGWQCWRKHPSAITVAKWHTLCLAVVPHLFVQSLRNPHTGIHK